MAISYPISPLAVNETVDVELRPGGHTQLRGIATGLWHTDVVGSVQTEIRLEPHGKYSVLVTNGKESTRSEWASWREAMIHGIV